MRQTVIISDSTCDLSKELIEQRQIEIIPFKIDLLGKTYDDGVDIDSFSMYEQYDKYKALPKSAAASIDAFINCFKKHVEAGKDVIYCGIGSKLSSGFQNAILAREELEDDLKEHVYLLDSASLSTGIGLVLLKLSDFINQGLSAKETVEKAKEIVPCVRAQFSVKELTFLHKGGRCSGTARFFGTMLRIHPILRLFDGKIILSEKIFGRYEKALDFQIDDIVRNINDVDDNYLFITHSLADEEANYIYNNLPDTVKNKFRNIYITRAGCVISTHCGKHTIGILYIKKTPLVDDK